MDRIPPLAIKYPRTRCSADAFLRLTHGVPANQLLSMLGSLQVERLPQVVITQAATAAVAAATTVAAAPLPSSPSAIPTAPGCPPIEPRVATAPPGPPLPGIWLHEEEFEMFSIFGAADHHP
ncbi:hypothetical protein H696_06050 [Fonticula alba]|uniref:Uncharacterized protein n=1 Tax=Fonticula alba TaxID=691883 RepID=A0A058Z209_FONAL|nr:hypothetical protein H696_06050 [Fonticula alba]KCV67532.1 hypothetical protein H696_06050 [Fonticula alba]|eukprot:XP_009498093.1 hypothetical protein H696_06050 [Fonticula alba]